MNVIFQSLIRYFMHHIARIAGVQFVFDPSLPINTVVDESRPLSDHQPSSTVCGAC